jgi:hypothetical protein
VTGRDRELSTPFYFFGNVRMIVPSTRSPTVLAALVRGSHLILRWPFSSHLAVCRFTFMTKTWTSQTTTFPFLSRFL